MEDQRGDERLLSDDEAESAVERPADDEEPQTSGETQVSGETRTDGDPEATEATEPVEPVESTEPDDPAVAAVPPARRPAGRAGMVALGAAAAAFVAAGAFAGAAVQPYLADRAQVDAKQAVAQTAADTITTLFTYTADDIGALPDRAAQYLGADFAFEYRQKIEAIAAAYQQVKVETTTQVLGAAVESIAGDDATAVVYTNTTSTSPQNRNIPSLQYRSYRLTLHRDGRRWYIDSMNLVTNLDITPRLPSA